MGIKMTIDEMINDILHKEGGYVNHKADKGGPTNYGVTQEVYSKYIGRTASADDVKNMSKQSAIDIYKKQYFIAPKFNLLPVEVQPIIFDIAVNSGPKKAVKMLQEVLDRSGYKVGEIDGILGKNTAEQAKRAFECLGSVLINQLVDRRLSFYRNIVKKDPTQKVFLAGWEVRARSFIA